MKKITIFTIVLVMFSGIALKAQMEKGQYFLAGSNRLEINIGGEKEKYDGDVDESSKRSYFDFDIQPMIGYTVINNLVPGLFMDLDCYRLKYKEDEYEYRENYFIFGPFIRYYFDVCDKLLPYVSGQIGFGVDNWKTRYSADEDWSKSKSSVFTYRIGGGATYFFNEHVGADAFLGFCHDSYKEKDSDDPERGASGTKDIYNEFIMQFGIIVLLGK